MTPPPGPRAPLPSAAAPGFTLVEVACALLLLTVLLGLAAPRLRGLADRSAVAAAREAVAGAVGRARARALVHGGATLRLRSGPARARVEAPGADTLRLALGEEYGVRLHLARGRGETEIRFDALGLGRMSSETVALRRNGAEVRLVISGYGRIRRP